MNKVNILFFATLKDRAGTARAELQIPDEIDVSALKDLLFQEFPALPKSRASLLVAINMEYAFDAEKIPRGAEIALFPPVSGG